MVMIMRWVDDELSIQSALTVHLVGHKTLTPGESGAISILISLKNCSLRGEYLISLVISCVVSMADFVTLIFLRVSLAAKFKECP